MKLFLVVVAFSISCVAANSGVQTSRLNRGDEGEKNGDRSEKYTNRYDTINLDEVLDNKRLLNSYTKCMLDQGKCTSEGRELKSHVSEALQNGCRKCTGAQRSGMRQVIKHFIKNEVDSWNQLVEKYDPKKIYTTKYEKELKSL